MSSVARWEKRMVKWMYAMICNDVDGEREANKGGSKAEYVRER